MSIFEAHHLYPWQPIIKLMQSICLHQATSVSPIQTSLFQLAFCDVCRRTELQLLGSRTLMQLGPPWKRWPARCRVSWALRRLQTSLSWRPALTPWDPWSSGTRCPPASASRTCRQLSHLTTPALRHWHSILPVRVPFAEDGEPHQAGRIAGKASIVTLHGLHFMLVQCSMR